MIGTDLNLSLPTLADTYSAAIAKVATALQAIEDSIAQKATPAGLDITSNLSIGGNHLTNVGGIILAAGNSPTSAGSLYYTGGNFYAKDATGVIQLTAGGAINLSAIGAIGGDYGSGPESFNYDLASTEFRARASGSAWADLVVDDVVLMEPSGNEFVRLHAPALAASYTVEFPAAVPSETSLLQMSSSGVLTASNVLPELDANTHVVVSGTGDYKHGEKIETMAIPFGAYVSGGVATRTFTSSTFRWSLPAGCVMYVPFARLRAGWRLKRVYAYGESASAGGLELEAQRLLVNQSGPGTTTTTGNYTSGSCTATLDTPYTVVEGDVLYVIIIAGAADINNLTSISLVYDIV